MRRPIFLVVAVMHVVWAILMLVYWPAKMPTPVFGLVDTFGSLHSAVLVIVAFSVLALVGAGTANGQMATTCLSGQQFVLLVSFGAGVVTVMAGRYPDGYAAPSWYILLDQSPGFAMEIAHTVALYRYLVDREWDSA